MANWQKITEGVQVLGRLVQPMGWLTSGTLRKVQYPNASQFNKPVQQDLDHMVGGLTIVYLFAVFESALPPGKHLSEWQSHHIDPAQLEELLAYRHIRHVVAHGLDGNRQSISTHRTEFEGWHNAGKFTNVVDWDRAADQILIRATGVWNPLQMFMTDVLSKVISNCRNQCPPGRLAAGQRCKA